MEVKAGYKLTEVGVIPDDWTISTITQASEMTTVGFVGSMSHLFTPSGVPVFRGQDVLPNKLDPSDTKFISLNTHKVWKKSALKGGDVVMVRVGVGAGTSCVIPNDIGEANAASLVVMRPSTKRLDATFLSMVINSEFGKRQVESLLVGGAQPVINTATVAAFKFPLPTVAEQQAIAEALSDADALIEALEGLIAKKRQVKQGAMQELLTGKRRLSGFTKKIDYKQTETGVIPEEWDVRSLGDVASFSQGLQVDLEKQSLVEQDGLIRFLRIENYTQKSDDFRYISARVDENKIVDEKDIVIVRYGATAGFIGRGLRGVLANNLFEVKPKPSLLTKDFLYLCLTSKRGFDYFQSSMAGGAMPALSFKIARALVLPLPSIPEQEAIAEILSDMDAEITALEAKLSKARDVKAGMMSVLLTGKVRLVESGK